MTPIFATVGGRSVFRDDVQWQFPHRCAGDRAHGWNPHISAICRWVLEHWRDR